MPYKYFVVAVALIAAVSITTEATAQVAPKTDVTAIRTRVETIRTFRTTNSKMVIESDLFDQKLDSVLNTVSGVTYINGKAALTSASVDDKGLTVNYNFDDGYQHTWQFTASGSAKKGLVDLFSGGKYSKTLTGGINYFYFPLNNNATPGDGEKDRLHARIDRVINYFDVKRQQRLGSTELASIKQIFDLYGQYFYTSAAVPPNLIAAYDAEYAEFGRLLKKYSYYFPSGFETLTHAEQQSAIDDVTTNLNAVLIHYYYKQELDSLVKVQLAVKFDKTFLNWWLFSAKINHDAYPIFDASAAKKNYVKTIDDYYPSFSLGYTAVWLHPKTNWMLLPLLKYQNSRNFKTDNLLSLDIPQNVRNIKGQTTSDYKQTSYYNTIADRKKAFNIEVPGVVFFPKEKVPFGIELALNTTIDGQWQDFGGRIGFYVTLPGAKQNVVIEPLIRVDPWKAGSSSFGKDQLSFGINLTVALPSYITGQAKKAN